MAKYHVNGAGEAGPCKATQGNCPFGGEDKHYSTPEEARSAYEETTTKKKGLFGLLKTSVTKPKRDQNPIPEKDRRSTDGVLDFRRFEGLLSIAKKQKWDVMEDGTLLRASGDKQNTFVALSQLQREDREGGTAFEQADRLKAAYAKFREDGEVEAPSYGPDVISRDAYLRMVAPATHSAVNTVEVELEKYGWDARVDPNEPDSNVKAFSKIFKLDMDTAEGRTDAVKILQESGWYLEDDEDTVAEAVKQGQAVGATYGSRFKFEQEYMF